MYLRKDQSLVELARTGNVAQFVSYAPGSRGPEQAYLRIQGLEPNHGFDTPREALTELMRRSSDGSVNVRSYTPDSPRSR